MISLFKVGGTQGRGSFEVVDSEGQASLLVNGGPLAEGAQVGSITTAGGTTIPAGTLQDTLQAIADLADPAG